MASCPVCRHERCDEADRMLREGATVRAVAAFLALGKSTVDRHKKHLFPGSGQAMDSESRSPDTRESTPPDASPCVQQVGATTATEGYSREEWRVMAPVVRYLTRNGTPATATAGDEVSDVHPVFVKALMAARVLVPTRKHPATEGGSDA